MITLDTFISIIKDYIVGQLHGIFVSEFTGIDHGLIYKWSRTSKLVISTTHSFPAIFFDGIFSKVIDLLNTDESAPGRVDLFSYFSINDDKKVCYKKLFADAGFDLVIHDQKELVAEPYFAKIYDVNDDSTEQDFASDLLCKYLINGRDAVDLKNIVLRSNITLSLYSNPKQSYEKLLANVQGKLGKNIDSIKNILKKLEKESKIIRDNLNQNLYVLSDHEKQSIDFDIKNGVLEKERFKQKIKELIENFKIDTDVDKIISILVAVYKQHCGIDAVSGQVKNAVSAKEDSIYQEIRQEITSEKLANGQYKSFLSQLKDICSGSSYLNRIVRNEAFQKLYSTNKLSDFLSKRECIIYIDTPVIIYLLCSKTVFAEDGVMWDDYYYNSTLNLLSTKRNRFKKLTFKVMYNYILEVAGELRKALRTAWFFEKNPKLPIIPETANTFYNYYEYLIKKGVLTKGTSFFSFVHDNFNVSISDSENHDFISIVASDIFRLLQALRFSVDSDSPKSDKGTVLEIERRYEIFLQKDKTTHAISNDVRQTVLLSEKSFQHRNNGYDYYFASWDRSTIPLIKWMNETFANSYGSYRVDNPSSLANRFSLATLDIDSQSITYDVFAYADKEYNISSKIKDLYDNVIIPIFGSSRGDNSQTATRLLQIQKDYDDQKSEDDSDKPNDKLALEKVFDGIFSKLSEWKSSIYELSMYLTDDSNLNLITQVVQDSFKLISKNKSFDSEIDLFGQNLRIYLGEQNSDGKFE